MGVAACLLCLQAAKGQWFESQLLEGNIVRIKLGGTEVPSGIKEAGGVGSTLGQSPGRWHTLCEWNWVSTHHGSLGAWFLLINIQSGL